MSAKTLAKRMANAASTAAKKTARGTSNGLRKAGGAALRHKKVVGAGLVLAGTGLARKQRQINECNSRCNPDLDGDVLIFNDKKTHNKALEGAPYCSKKENESVEETIQRCTNYCKTECNEVNDNGLADIFTGGLAGDFDDVINDSGQMLKYVGYSLLGLCIILVIITILRRASKPKVHYNQYAPL